ncbi:S-methyl-5-thioribose kinase [Fictibacillus fluitans]|uniref:Methylthioribose kinase n=1 Tax=Fictibacillus fluitans TaxID=3058422 RepID=A0ABT8HSI2_9BACL|nr:S-methyl-5-thioribose kinase [Fictibacillus sp. NE201]MDN4523721.1 S-methyl-5-thioribose kinase [Fictibacillus sp. NE201]
MATTTKQAYTPLNEQTVIELSQELNLFTEYSSLEVNEIGDGNLNLVFRLVEPSTKKSVIIKQALPYAKVVGESWPLTLDRARIESDSLKKFAEFAPEHVPEVLYSNNDLAVTVMEDLSSHVILRKGLIDGETYPNLAQHIGTFIAKNLFYTSDFYLHPFEKKRLVQQFTNPELCKITEDLVFTDPFYDIETNDFPAELQDAVSELWNDPELRKKAARLKLKFLTNAEALLHGDLHSGSIFVIEESTKIIDSEFAYYGPQGFDIAHFFANIAMNHIAQRAHIKDVEKRAGYQLYLSGLIRDTWNVFTSTYKELWRDKGVELATKLPGFEDEVLEEIFTDMVGFAGCEVIRRTIGLAHVADLDSIADFDEQIRLKKKVLKLGSDWVKNKQRIKNIEEFITSIRSV